MDAEADGDTNADMGAGLGAVAAVVVLGCLGLLLMRAQRAREKRVMSAIDDLIKQVQQNTDVEQSAVQAFQGLATQLQQALAQSSAAQDPKLQALTQQLAASATALGAAVVANTPATAPAEQVTNPGA